MEVICLHDEAFYKLVDEVVFQLRDKINKKQEKWVSTEKAMQILNIKSKTTLQKLRDSGSISYTQPVKKIILYDVDSIIKFLDNHSKEAFK
tara:strand:+ start:699574 stop:699846 length:273 start_codon:yes stop_codon:yes gene_type:complete